MAVCFVPDMAVSNLQSGRLVPGGRGNRPARHCSHARRECPLFRPKTAVPYLEQCVPSAELLGAPPRPYLKALESGAIRLSHTRRVIMKLLHIDSGILGTASVSRQLSAEAVAEWRARHPNTEVVYRDLVAQPLTHLAGDQLFAAGADASQRSPEMNAILSESDKVLEEFLEPTSW